MKKYVVMFLVVCSVLCSFPASANSPALDLGTCLTDSMNGKERKGLAKWIYFGMSAHSSIKPYSKVTDQDVENSNKWVGTLITRLMTVDCSKQAKAASDAQGSAAFQQAFRIVGEVAMQEIMTEPAVGESLGAFEKYLDKDKINEIFK